MNRRWALGMALLVLALPLRADIRQEEAARRQRRLDAELRQLFFGKAIVKEARTHIGQPYVWGGKDGKPGFDCSGYTKAVFAALGVELPDGAAAQLRAGTAIERGALQPGDLLFFIGRGSPFHVGIYEGDGRFLQAPGTGKRIQSTALQGAWTGWRWIGARRFYPPKTLKTPDPATTTTTQEKKP